MKKIITFSILVFLHICTFAQTDTSGKFNNLLKKSRSVFSKNAASPIGLSSVEIADGLKQALSLGAQKSGDQLSGVDGFFKDAAVKILLPKEVR
ncbi:MAG: DUF4197 family protein, partial [Ginsengibacter sp.]